MYDKELVVDILKKLDIAIDVIVKRTESIHEPNDFLTSWMGTLILDGVCMKLTALGESIKNLDKITNKELLSQYPEIPWRGVMGTRDIIAHHYFDVDAFEIFSICKNDLVPLQVTIKKMISDLEQDVKGSVGTGQ
ncbi:MAG: DUF86 domain-containing protein [Prevotellaceae bacterium]|nr:DUF86 domain-containing protein [Candidatus Colivivens equi]